MGNCINSGSPQKNTNHEHEIQYTTRYYYLDEPFALKITIKNVDTISVNDLLRECVHEFGLLIEDTHMLAFIFSDEEIKDHTSSLKSIGMEDEAHFRVVVHDDEKEKLRMRISRISSLANTSPLLPIHQHSMNWVPGGKRNTWCDHCKSTLQVAFHLHCHTCEGAIHRSGHSTGWDICSNCVLRVLNAGVRNNETSSFFPDV